jgi:hypothetical protein
VTKKIQEGTITAEQFQQNPGILNDTIEEKVGARKRCDTCQEEKQLYNFEPQRRECRACRTEKISAMHQEKMGEYLMDIERVRLNLKALEEYLQHLPKDALILVISHYKIGRKASDVKSTMIHNTLHHFRGLLCPEMCQGGCGSTVVAPLLVCKKCEKKPPCPRNNKRQEFIDNLDDIVEKLEPMRNRVVDIDRFTKDQLSMIARKLQITFLQVISKESLFEKINEVLEKRERDRVGKKMDLKNNAVEIQDLMINGLTIQARSSDCFINATLLCRAGNKKFADWSRQENTKHIIDSLSREMGVPNSLLVDAKKGNSTQFTQGSWIHPDLAVHLAMWISSDFGVKVSRWIREIMITGHASRDVQKTNDQLITLQMQLQQKEDDFRKLQNKHKIILQRREYYKLERGKCFYIIQVNDTDFKIGFEGVDINERLRAHRTSIPHLKLCYLVYSADAYLIEQSLLRRFDRYKIELNHEFITSVSPFELISSTQTFVDFCNLKVHNVSGETMEQYNES